MCSVSCEPWCRRSSAGERQDVPRHAHTEFDVVPQRARTAARGQAAGNVGRSQVELAVEAPRVSRQIVFADLCGLAGLVAEPAKHFGARMTPRTFLAFAEAGGGERNGDVDL